MKTVQILVNVPVGVDAVKFFNDLNRALHPVLTQYEDAVNKDIEVSAYILDEQGVAVY
jgi:hypothetical protein